MQNEEQAAPVKQGDMIAEKYRVDRVLGAGGMGVVVLATDVTLERQVAIKFLLEEHVKHREATERFLREARAAVRIQSEHVARVIDVGTLKNGAPYMVMEYLVGTDLSQVIEEKGRTAVEDAVGYVLEACEAIAEAHAAGIVHRDLKPANLFLARKAGGHFSIKVLDFGISKHTSPSTSAQQSLTRTSTMMGSPLYMSPEQMRSSRDVDSRTDIWALGVILYELLTGKPPFVAESMPELVALILQDQPQSPRADRPEMPVGLEPVVLRALEKDPVRRYQNVGEFAQALLPFGPRSARVSVERISRVLHEAGLSSHDIVLPASLAPRTAPSEAQTAVDFGRTASETSNKRSPVVPILAALGTLLILGGGAALLIVGRDPVRAADIPAPIAEPAAKPVATQAPASPEAIPTPTPEATVTAAPLASALPPEPAPSASPAASVAVVPPTRVAPRMTKAKTAAKASAAAAPAPAPAPAPPPAPAPAPASTGVRSKFGTRK
jgi:serine/threonine protein kinase